MKKLQLFSLLFLVVSTVVAQGIYMEVGKVDSRFEFVDSQGVELDNLQPTTQNYIEAGFRHELLTEGLNVSLGLNYNSYGSIGSDDSRNNFFEWDVDYLGIVLGLDYRLFEYQKLAFHLHGSTSLEFLLQGTQTINNQVINLTDIEEFDDNAIFFRGGAGLSYPLSDNSEVYLQYLYGGSLGLNDDNGNSTSEEELKIKTHMVGVGLRINITRNENDSEDPNDSDE